MGAAAVAHASRAAGFDWKRYSGTQLRFMVSVHPWTQWAQTMLPALERDTGIKLRWEILYEDQLRQKLPLTLRADPGAVDGFFTLPSWDAAAFSRAGWYAPLDSFIKSDLTAPDWDITDFFPNILKIQQYGGVQVGIPITIEVQTLFYNKSMLTKKQLAPPATLDALMTTAKALNDPKNDVSGIVTRGDGVQAVYTFAPFLFAFGGRWQDEKGNPELATAAAISALKYYGELLRTAGPPNILGMQWKTTYPLFQQAHSAMFIDASNFLTFFKDPSQSRIVNDVGVATLPAGPAGEHSTVISWGPAIAASSKQQDATWLAIQYLTSKAAMASST
ncbi:MAG: ABC transporter substrate-binding protein, partial [Acetobacteraceae bacterium]